MIVSMPCFFTAEKCSPTVLSSFERVSSTMYTSATSVPSMQVSSADRLSYQIRISPAYAASVIPPPPSYSSVASLGTALVPPPSYSAVCRDGTSETDVDVVGITDDARDVRLSDDDEEESNDQPLDLSVKKKKVQCSTSCSASSSSAQLRPSVIRNGYAGRNVDMRRSASSVTSRPNNEPDVSEHFRRSLSGKWPRRQTNHAHYTPPQVEKEKIVNALQRKNSQSTLGSPRKTPPTGVSPPQQIIVNNSGIEIEDHFRKALGAEAYELLCKSRQMNLV